MKRIGATWQLDQSGPTILLGKQTLGRLDQSKVSNLELTLTNLKILKITSFKPDLQDNISENFKLYVVDDIGEWTYTFVKHDRKYYVNRNDRERYFTLKEEVYESIAAAATQSKLLVESP